MASDLVVIGSPAKVETIKKFLGSNYVVNASQGHVHDLSRPQLGIDVEHGYEPRYIIIRGKGDVLTRPRKEMKKANRIYLATDPDREGEAISWHLQRALKLEGAGKRVYRITFNEITKNAVRESIKHPREIGMGLVNTQQIRRILGRMVGYSISPLLWAKVERGLLAGRMQSVALRMIYDREAEIKAFMPKEYQSLEAVTHTVGGKRPLKACYYGVGKKKMELHSETECLSVIKDCESKPLLVQEIKKSERSRKAPLPFTTSTLQQEASKRLNFSTQKTMRVAQQLYEGVEVEGGGTIALVTYLRTNSTRIAEETDAAVRAYIHKNYEETYAAAERKEKQDGQKIQGAHEAIHPIDITLTPVTIEASLSRDQFRLYQLIWKRFAAGRMQEATYASTSVKLVCDEYRFFLSDSSLKFSGFIEVYGDGEEKEEEKPDAALLKLSKGEEFVLEGFDKERHFTQPPVHYTEANLVRAMEGQSIGRPSTYAPTITTIPARRYVIREQKSLHVTELGQIVNRMVMKSFPVIVEPQFATNLECLLDSAGEGKMNWRTVVKDFYPGLNATVKQTEEELGSVKIADEESDVDCELCGRYTVIRYGPRDKFPACPGLPECRNAESYLEKTGVKYPKCGNELVHKRTKKGHIYYGCENNPTCEFIGWTKPSEKRCSKCGEYATERGNKLVCADEACGYSEMLGKKNKD